MAVVTFRLASGDDRQLPLASLAPVIHELEEIGTQPARDLAHELGGARDGTVVELGDGRRWHALLRALDHLRNAGATRKPEHDLRGWLLSRSGLKPLSYDLEGWPQMPQAFCSYSGQYQVGDRLVAGDGTELRVRDAGQPSVSGVRGRLECDPWRP